MKINIGDEIKVNLPVVPRPGDIIRYSKEEGTISYCKIKSVKWNFTQSEPEAICETEPI